MAQLAKWSKFSSRVLKHIAEYVIPQYGDENDPAEEYSAEDCIKQAQKYLARFGRSSRPGEEIRDLCKAAHYIQKAADKINPARETLPDPVIGGVAVFDPEIGVTFEPETFAGTPLSVAEHRANREEDGSLWRPRDAVISFLRDLDSGEIKNVDAVFIAFRMRGEGNATVTKFRQATPDYHTALGLIEAAKYKMSAS